MTDLVSCVRLLVMSFPINTLKIYCYINLDTKFYKTFLNILWKQKRLNYEAQ